MNASLLSEPIPVSRSATKFAPDFAISPTSHTVEISLESVDVVRIFPA